jgi:hypothetical protein
MLKCTKTEATNDASRATNPREVQWGIPRFKSIKT